MKILYIAPDVPVPHTGKFLGGSTHVLKVADSLAKKGCEILIISRRMRGQPKYERISERVKTMRVYRGLIFPVESTKRNNIGKNKSAIFERLYFLLYRIMLSLYVLFLLTKGDFDLVVERNSAKGIGVFPARIFGIRSIVEVIDTEFSKLQLRFADKILAYTKRIIPEEFQNKVVLTHAGVDVEEFKVNSNVSEVREKYGLGGKRVVVYVGEMSEWHGAEMLLDVAERLSEKLKFLMVGKQLLELNKEAEKRGVADKFVFVGFIPHKEVSKYISAGDVCVAPYKPNEEIRKWGFYFSPIKIFEYMACGKAVVASDLDIIRDIILENKCGLLAKPDAEDFAAKVKILIDDARLRNRLGKNGKKAVLKYTWDKVADKILGG